MCLLLENQASHSLPTVPSSIVYFIVSYDSANNICFIVAISSLIASNAKNDSIQLRCAWKGANVEQCAQKTHNHPEWQIPYVKWSFLRFAKYETALNGIGSIKRRSGYREYLANLWECFMVPFIFGLRLTRRFRPFPFRAQPEINVGCMGIKAAVVRRSSL